MQTISVYIHIPFCISKCRYCDFYSIPYDESSAAAYIESVFKEWSLVGGQTGMRDLPVSTIYIGGGTPSVLNAGLLESLVSRMQREFNCTSGYEWSVEINPESFTKEKAGVLADAGVTRVTFGVQSLDDRMLKLLRRPHTAGQALSIIESSSLERFHAIGVDILYGLPGQSVENVSRDVTALTKISIIKHLSAYELTLYEKTPLGRHRSMLPLPDEDHTGEMHSIISSVARASGFEHYEVSNYARSGYRCRHNEQYWNHHPYIGLGPGAHSFDGKNRWANCTDIKTYMGTLENNEQPLDFCETLDTASFAREMVFLGMRRSDGIDEREYYRKTGIYFAKNQQYQVLQQLMDSCMVLHEGHYWRPTEKGMLFADAIARMLMP